MKRSHEEYEAMSRDVEAGDFTVRGPVEMGGAATVAYGDGWNDALDAIADRLLDAEKHLRDIIADATGAEDDRLRGKLQGVTLAYDYARSMKR